MSLSYTARVGKHCLLEGYGVTGLPLARELWINLELVERDHKCMHLMVKCVGCCDNEASLCASQSIRKEKVTVLVVSLWLGLFHRRSSKFESLSHLQGQALLVWRCRGSSVILWKGRTVLPSRFRTLLQEWFWYQTPLSGEFKKKVSSNSTRSQGASERNAMGSQLTRTSYNRHDTCFVDSWNQQKFEFICLYNYVGEDNFSPYW